MLLLGNSIAWSQSITQDSLGGKWYTKKQRINCNRCLVNEVIIDSMLTDCEVERINLKNDFDNSVKIIEDLRLEAILKDEEIVKLKTHRKILLSVSGGLIGLVVILFLVP